ncbi:MAG: ATP-binding protein [Mariprofundales bacterium]|nr:ATP-binding protein [Mariprofundales bacterium]
MNRQHEWQQEAVPVAVNIQNSEDVIELRRSVRSLANSISMGLADQARVVMCATELAENIIKHSESGCCSLAIIKDDHDHSALCIECRDRGAGIADVDAILREQQDEKPSLLGAGLVGVKRVADQFSLQSGAEGTVVRVVCVPSTSLGFGYASSTGAIH